MKKSLGKEILGHLIICGSNLVVNSLFIPYGQSLKQTLRKIDKTAARCPHNFSDYSKNTVSVTLQRMKKKKFITASKLTRKTIWRITNEGKRHFKKIPILPPEDGKTRIVMFDIPEERRVERNWLRAELLSCDYTLLQKSVFIGKRPLPRKLLEELKDKKLISHVHIVGLEGNFI